MSYRPFSPSLFGPYRDYYENRLRQLNAPQTNQEEKRVESLQSEFVKIAETKDKIDFKAFHKKQNVKFFQSQESRRTDRATKFTEDRKEKRNQILMEKRKCAPVSATKEQPPSARPVGNINEPTGNTGKESRREQLLRWKKEKEAVMSTAKTAAKPPFKAGQTNASVSAKGSLTENAINTSRLPNPNLRPTTASAHVNFSSVSSKSNTNITKDININGARRVTRAMAKSQIVPNNRPPVSKMEKLNLDGKPKAKTALNQKSALPISEVLPQTNSDVKKVEPDLIKNVTTVEVAPSTVPKKLKPKAIDKVYIEFNSTFSKACETLKAYSEEWKLIVNWPDIPEDIREEIILSIGRVNLLLDSKLPQFGQLLYSYLCREADPLPILPCDLQGWWDVASIQVEKVKSQFVKLKQLQVNSWKEEAVNPPAKTNKPLTVKPDNKISIEIKKKPAHASKGILQFLAMKRQLTLEPVKNEEKKLNVVVNESPEKRFEGGFFEVNSPVKRVSTPRMSTRLSSIKAESPLTPTRRASSTNMSLRMLTLRQSMGKIGIIRSEESIRLDALNCNKVEDKI